MGKAASPVVPRPRVGGKFAKSVQIESIDDHFDALSLTQLECKGDWHTWPRGVRFAPVEWHGKTDLVKKQQRVLICAGGCGTVRTDWIKYARDGRITYGRAYKYDADYKWKTPPGGRQLKKSDYRQRLRQYQQPELNFPTPGKRESA